METREAAVTYKPVQLRPVTYTRRQPLKPSNPTYPHVLGPWEVFELDTRGIAASIAALLDSASYFVALLHDIDQGGVNTDAWPPDARAQLAELTQRLHAAGHMNAYVQKDGSIRVS